MNEHNKLEETGGTVMKTLIEEIAAVILEKAPTKATIQQHINAFSVADDPYDVAVEIGKRYDWSQKQIEKAENIIRKNFIK